MLQFVIHKIKNKKWLNLCLLAGITLLAAVFACHPMFAGGADNWLLQTGFADYVAEKEEFPAVFARSGSYDTKQYKNVQTIYERLDAYEAKWTEYVNVDPVGSQQSLKLSGDSTESSLGRGNIYLSVGLLRDMEDHIQVVKGEDYNTTESHGVFSCLISESVMDTYGLVVGEEVTFPYSLNKEGEPARFRIAGIIKEASTSDNYWYHDLTYYEEEIFVTQETFDTLIADYGFATVQFEDNLLLNYTQINGKNAMDYLSYIQEFQQADKAFSTNLVALLKSFATQRQTVRTILWVLELPCIVLLLLFIYMVSNQVLGTEEGEIASLRSRGVTRGQTMFLYILQSLLLSLAGMLFGTAMGFGMCKGAVSTDGFLHFVKKDVSLYTFTPLMLLYALAACAIAMLFMTIPVWKRARLTIVEQKSGNSQIDRKPFWEKCFLDVILLCISCYLLYNYRKQTTELSLRVIGGENLDPMIFLNASLFIFSCGLLFLRLIRYLVLLIDRIGKKRWKPAMYASFLQITRTFHRQSFISVFLIMTIASGIFNANMARTMNRNNDERITYNIGTDVRLLEKWKLHIYWTDDGTVWYYDEPDFGRYDTLVEQGICDRVTRVIEDNRVDVSAGGKIFSTCHLMGISTKEFGETARLKEGLNDTHWFNALNALAGDANSVIISQNLAEEASLKVGDAITYTRYSPLQPDQDMGTVSATVCAIVECFPGYERYNYVTDENGKVTEKENYLVVGNYAAIASDFKMTPYSIWMRFSEGAVTEQVKNWISEEKIALISWISMEENLSKSKNSALIQITNGLFTMTFFISILICSVGFLIYWIMSIQSRELMFGIYRAMGMRMKEIRRMLVNEQIFGSLLPIAAGAGIGALGTKLYVKLLTLVYLPKKHNIPICIYIEATDFAKLFAVIAAVVFICFFVLRRLLRKMKIAQALKLGED